VIALLALALLGADGGQTLGPSPRVPVARVVTVAPSLTDTVLALDGGSTLVGVSRFDEASEVAQVPRVGGFSDPSVEAVVALKPSVVLVQKAPGNQRPAEDMARLGLSVVALPLTSVADVEDAMRTVGQLLGRPADGEALAARLESQRSQVRARAAGKKKLKVLLLYGYAPLVVAGPHSFAHELLADVGAENLAADAAGPYPVYSAERAARLKPDVVLEASDTQEGREALRRLPGLRDARWVALPTKSLLQPGPKLVQGLVELEAALRPPAR